MYLRSFVCACVLYNIDSRFFMIFLFAFFAIFGIHRHHTQSIAKKVAANVSIQVKYYI